MPPAGARYSFACPVEPPRRGLAVVHFGRPAAADRRPPPPPAARCRPRISLSVSVCPSPSRTRTRIALSVSVCLFRKVFFLSAGSMVMLSLRGGPACPNSSSERLRRRGLRRLRRTGRLRRGGGGAAPGSINERASVCREGTRPSEARKGGGGGVRRGGPARARHGPLAASRRRVARSRVPAAGLGCVSLQPSPSRADSGAAARRAACRRATPGSVLHA